MQSPPGSRPLSSHSVREITGPGMPRGVESIFEDSQGRIWLSSMSSVGYLERDRFVVMNDVRGGLTRAIVEDRQKTLWFANPIAGLFRLGPDRRAAEQTSWTVLKHKDSVSAAAADPSGDGLWFGFFRGGIVHFADGQVRASYTASDGLAEGRVSSLYADRAGTLWIASDGGLNRLANGRLSTMNSTNGLPC